MQGIWFFFSRWPKKIATITDTTIKYATFYVVPTACLVYGGYLVIKNLPIFPQQKFVPSFEQERQMFSIWRSYDGSKMWPIMRYITRHLYVFCWFSACLQNSAPFKHQRVIYEDMKLWLTIVTDVMNSSARIARKKGFSSYLYLLAIFFSMITDMTAMCSLHAIVYLFVDTSRAL